MMFQLTSQRPDQTVVLPTSLSEDFSRGMKTLTVHELSRQDCRGVSEGKKIHDVEMVTIGISLNDHSCKMECPERVTT